MTGLEPAILSFGSSLNRRTPKHIDIRPSGYSLATVGMAIQCLMPRLGFT